MKKQILSRIKAELTKMKTSTDKKYTKTYIPWNKEKGFSVECTRSDEEDKVYDSDGNLAYDMSRTPIEFEVYYQVRGKDLDVCTMSSFLDEADMKSLKEFVRMYR